jgi:hypothetical protein
LGGKQIGLSQAEPTPPGITKSQSKTRCREEVARSEVIKVREAENNPNPSCQRHKMGARKAEGGQETRGTGRQAGNETRQAARRETGQKRSLGVVQMSQARNSNTSSRQSRMQRRDTVTQSNNQPNQQELTMPHSSHHPSPAQSPNAPTHATQRNAMHREMHREGEN